MTQPAPHAQTQSPPQAQQAHPLFQSSDPNFHSFAQYIQAAATGNRDALFHLVVVIVSYTKSALAGLCKHFKSHPRALTLDHLARIKYCATRLQAIFHTLRHAPERFLKPAQLRALTRLQAVLSHFWRQPVDFSPLTPLLTSPKACPPPPRATPASSSVTPASSESEPSSAPSASFSASPPLRVPASSSSPADPLLLRSPGRALASVLLHIAALYGISTHPAPRPRTAAPAPSTAHHPADQSINSATPSAPPDAPAMTPSDQTSWTFEAAHRAPP